MWNVQLDRKSGTPLQLQIYQHYYQAIVRGALVAGEMMPSIRKLACKLRVGRITVVLAYAKLVDCRLLFSRPGIGYQIIFTQSVEPVSHQEPAVEGIQPAALMAAAIPNDLYSQPNPELYCQISVPDANAFPWSSWRKWNNAPSSQKEQLLTRYHSPHGLLSLREEVVRYLRITRGIETSAENIVITNGIQEGLSLITQLFVLNRMTKDKSPCHIVTESPCYSGAWHLFNYYGAQMTAVRVDEFGLCVNSLPEQPTQLCYITPSHQYPLGCRLSPSRRSGLVAWAQRVGAYIIEDDYDAVFSYGERPLPALKAMDPFDRVIYAGTFSKTLGPGTRLGYLVCPDAILESVQNMKALSNSGNHWLFQQFLADYMHNQVFYTHLSKLSCQYQSRLNFLHSGLTRLFPGVKIWGELAGLHLCAIAPLPEPLLQQLQQRCLRAGVRFDTLHDLKNGSESAWEKNTPPPIALFGFGRLTLSQLQHVLCVIERELRQLTP